MSLLNRGVEQVKESVQVLMNTPQNTPTGRKSPLPIGEGHLLFDQYPGMGDVFTKGTVWSENARKRTHLLRDDEVVGSNPATPTEEKGSSLTFLRVG